MYIKKVTKILAILVLFCAFFGGCEAIDAILPSAGNYKVNIQINDIPLDECSFVKSEDEIFPYFEESVSDDKDVTGLVVFLRNSSGEVVGGRVIYSLENEDALRDGLIISVESLDGVLPPFSVPGGLPMGRYTLVYQVMSGKSVLQKMEKSFFYLSRNVFSYEGINVYMPGVARNSLLIPRDTVIMLEAAVDFDSRLNPYVIWYEGKRKISEGKLSEGAGHLFWQAPEQSGFFSLRAEVFPIDNIEGFAGYQKEISLLVSSNTMNINLVSENIPQLVRWYTFANNLNDSKAEASAEHALKPAEKNNPVWMGANGTYGLATGQNNVFFLPGILIPDAGREAWQTLFRFKSLEDGIIFSAAFDRSGDVSMHLSAEDGKLVLMLKSPAQTVSQSYNIPPAFADNSFLVAGVNFVVLPDRVTAQLNIVGDFIDGELAAKPISLKAVTEDEFQIQLGFPDNNNETDEEASENMPEPKRTINTIWDEFALYYKPPMEIIIEELKPLADEDQASFDSINN